LRQLPAGGKAGGIRFAIPPYGLIRYIVYMSATTNQRTFAVVLEPEEDGGFTVRVPAFPEIVSYGADEREALAMAEDAIRLVIEDCKARGEPIPDGEPPQIRKVTVTLAA
jgi:antitoxin HicB